jgi:carbamoyl-phosphate synthase small subunit
MNNTYLILQDGTTFRGKSLGIKGTTFGETVFTTGVVGYQETLTDPSYYGQIVTQTFPLIGNYGVNNIDFESRKSFVRGYVVREACDFPSNFRCEKSLEMFLVEQNIIGICGIDTRKLTRKIREHGVMNGCITDTPDKISLEDIKNYKIEQSVENTTSSEPQTFGNPNGKHIALFDFGYKYNIRRELEKRGAKVTVLPAETTAAELEKLAVSGIMLSNGPGNPEDNVRVIDNLKEICEMGIPIFGICLGHQLMALASGGRTKKLHYGHRGAKQPEHDRASGLTYVPSQNHGYAVVGESIDKAVGEVSHINANDKTCEGVRYKKWNAFTVQFHPEACGGPLDTGWLFDEFLQKC